MDYWGRVTWDATHPTQLGLPPTEFYILLAASATILITVGSIIAKRTSKRRRPWDLKVEGPVLLLLFTFLGTWLQLLAILLPALFFEDVDLISLQLSLHGHGVIHFVLLISMGLAVARFALLSVDWQSEDAHRI